MLLGTKKTLYDHITEALLDESMTVSRIMDYLADKKIPATVQGIYKTLRELISEDIVVKQKKMYLVNNVWREKMTDMVSRRIRFTLSPQEMVTYRFNKLDHMDAFWKHTLADIEMEVGTFPVFHFTPHQFWSYVPGRRESEAEYYADLKKHETHAYTIIGGTNPSDKIAQAFLKTDFHQVHMDALAPFNRRDHLSVIGPYIITTRVSVTLARATDHLYAACSTEQELTEKLEPVFKKSGNIIMTVEHDETKAKKLRKQMSKEFHVPIELRNKFDLF